MKKPNELDKPSIQIILDQSLIDEFLSYNFKSIKREIFIIMSNGHLDYLKYEKSLDKLNLAGNIVSIITQSNFFDYKKFNHYALNNFKINKNNSLRCIKGVGFLKKIKFYYPLVFSIINFLKNFKISINFLLKKKIVYVGRASKKETDEAIKILLNNQNIDKKIIKNILNEVYVDNPNIKFIFNEIKKISIKKDEFIYLYFFCNVILRYLLIKHLKNFDCFFHKTNKKYNLELLYSNLYKKITQLDFGVKIGNCFAEERTINLIRFYNNNHIKINFFKEDVNYNLNQEFNLRINNLILFLEKLNKFNNYVCSSDEFKSYLKSLDQEFLS